MRVTKGYTKKLGFIYKDKPSTNKKLKCLS